MLLSEHNDCTVSDCIDQVKALIKHLKPKELLKQQLFADGIEHTFM
jgi:signal transduction histidine kinase